MTHNFNDGKGRETKPKNRKAVWFGYIMVLYSFAMVGCSVDKDDGREQTAETETRFTKLTSTQTGIEFRNDVNDLGKYTPHNTYYIYNGGGVAVGDIDNDGLEDLLFSSNQNGCKLYRNLGDFQFEDITEKAGITYGESWTTGVCMIDINSDGWMDIHICRSGLAPDTNWVNLLYINNGNGTFTEQAEQYGLNDLGTSTQIHFFDIDKDGDLDAYVLNHPVDFENSFDPFFDVKPLKDSIYSNRFYLNENGKFVEANSKLGVPLEKGFSLSASIGDINNDGWPDIYVANDFISPDHYYINQNGKGFVDRISTTLDKTTLFSMGSDLADVNNDGRLDLFVADMEPRDHFRRKNNNFNLDKSYYDLVHDRFSYPQYTRNMFYAGSSSGFKEIGHLAGISMTDWTWATLFEDLDNDGFKDLFVVNGTKRDFHDLDYVGLDFDRNVTRSKKRHGELELIANMPISLLPNHAFLNTDGFRFEDVSVAWGLADSLNGQGAIIADLNNDGALDIVVNNTDAPASIYRNNGTVGSHYIRIALRYKKPNLNAIGARVEVWTENRMQLKYQYPIRGFQSSMSTVLHFGIGKYEAIDSIIVMWPDGKVQKETEVSADQKMELHYRPNAAGSQKIVSEKWFEQGVVSNVTHVENEFDEVQRDRIVPFGLSRSGPAMATADLNGDGIDDLIVGSSIGNEIQILFGRPNGGFSDSGNHLIGSIPRENTALLLFDVDNDGDQDLYIGNGSNETQGLTESLRDLLYLNDGNGSFALNPNAGPDLLMDTRCIVALDVNKDGVQDIFIGGGFVPGAYGRSVGSRMLVNDNGKLVDATDELAPGLKNLGAVHAAIFADLNGDGRKQLITAGPWEPISAFDVTANGLVESDAVYPKTGLWNILVAADLNADGHTDIVAGNQGLNGIFKASKEQPLELFLADFDGNGTLDPIVTHYLNNESRTFIGKDDFCEKMPGFNNKYLTYREFAEAELSDIIATKKDNELIHRQVQELETVILMNDGKGNFTKVEIPIDAQFAPVKAICIHPTENDPVPLIMLFGNSDSEFYDQGPIRANHGCILQMDESGNYAIVSSDISGIDVDGVVNSCVSINGKGRSSIVLGRNNGRLIRIR